MGFYAIVAFVFTDFQLAHNELLQLDSHAGVAQSVPNRVEKNVQQMFEHPYGHCSKSRNIIPLNPGLVEIGIPLLDYLL